MAAKRIAPVDETDDQTREKRMKSIPSFTSVIREVMMAKSVQSFVNSFEPMLRRVVTEEVERGIQRTMRTVSRVPSFRIQAPEPACMKLMFTNKELPTIFTCNKITDTNGESLNIILVEKIGDQIIQKVLPHPIKFEIVVIDGDFPSSDRDIWTVDEFNRSIVKERAGRRPIIAKDVHYTIRNNGSCVTLSEIEITDNSSWIRSRKFRLGARVIPGTSDGCGRILEALTEAFIVKDQRGEVYKKHYPPMLEDEVWRLEKIGKDGKFHKRLEKDGIRTVQDFLKLSTIDSTKLKKILGGKAEISDRMWDSILKHAKTCNIGDKLYIYRGLNNCTITFDATCNIISINNNDDEIYSNSDFIVYDKNEKIDEMVKNAYENWDSLQEVDKSVIESLQKLQGNLVAECSTHQQYVMPNEVVGGGLMGIQGGDMIQNNLPMELIGNWPASPQLFL